ncbi:hypothetical protein ACP70R_022757 [Stipagrostis hirtigluma subsp. patula]
MGGILSRTRTCAELPIRAGPLARGRRMPLARSRRMRGPMLVLWYPAQGTLPWRPEEPGSAQEVGLSVRADQRVGVCDGRLLEGDGVSGGCRKEGESAEARSAPALSSSTSSYECYIWLFPAKNLHHINYGYYN